MKKQIDLGSFSMPVEDYVSMLYKSLEKQRFHQAQQLVEKKSGVKPNKFVDKTIPTFMQAEIDGLGSELLILQQENVKIKQDNTSLRNENLRLNTVIEKLRKQLAPQYESMKNLFEEIGSGPAQLDHSKWDKWIDKVKGKQKDMILALLEHGGRMNRKQLGLLVGVVAYDKGGTFNTYVSELTTLRLVAREGDDIVLQEIIKMEHTMQEDFEHFMSYSGLWRETDEVKAKLLLAFDAAWTPTTYGARVITQERMRQISAEGWTPKHDDEHKMLQLGRAALCYLKFGLLPAYPQLVNPPDRLWPWDVEFWKPSQDRIKNLIKAGALIAAEIDRLQREKDAK